MALETPTPTLSRPEELLLRAQSGEVLVTDDRRICLGYMLTTVEHRDNSNVELAKLFGVNEKTIRKDRELNRKEVAEEITKDDISLVISDIRQDYDRYVQDINSALKNVKVGTVVWLSYQNAKMQMRLKVVSALQELGYYPRNLGAMTASKFAFRAHVAEDGSVSTRAVDDAARPEKKKKSSARSEESPEERAAQIEALETEFADNPAAFAAKGDARGPEGTE